MSKKEIFLWVVKVVFSFSHLLSGEANLDENFAERSQVDRKTREKIRELLLKDVQESWQLPTRQLEQKKAEVIDRLQEKREDLKAYAKKIIISKLNIQRLSFLEALQVLNEVVQVYDSENYGINFVLLDPEHRAPEVNLNVRTVSLDRIVRYLGEMTRFTPLYEGNTIVFRDRDLKQELKTCVFSVSRGSVLQILNYTDDQIAKSSEEERLKQFFEKIGISFEGKGTGFAYDGQSIVVTHEEICLKRIEAILQRYHHCQQIAIEAKFLEVQQGVLEELGVKWNFGENNNVSISSETGLRNLADLQVNRTSIAKEHYTQAVVPQFPNSLNFGGSVGDFLNANSILNHYQMNMLIKAIEQRSDADLMSAPKVTVLSGRKAEIVVAQELRYPENYRDGHAEVGAAGGEWKKTSAGTALMAGTPERFVTRNIGVEMSVIPLAEDDEHIHLCLEPCVTEFEGFVQYGGNNVVTYANTCKTYESGYFQPIFSTRRIKTEVSLKNGSTLVMGGLTREEVKETHDKVPLLSSIPLIGNLFKSKGQTSQKRNLLIFVTANLVDEDGKYTARREIKEMQPLQEF